MGNLSPGITTIYGPEGTLKTSIALTWPGKVRYYDFDLGFDRGWGAQELVEKGIVSVKKIILPEKSITTRHQKLEGFMALWQEFTVDFNQHCEDDSFHTLVIDTCTFLWALVRDAYLEELQIASVRANKPMRKQLLQIEFGEPNGRMRSILNTPKAHEKHLVLVHHETDEYAVIIDSKTHRPILDDEGNPKSSTTGRKLPEGFKYTTKMSDWVLRTGLRYEQSKLVGAVTIEKSARGIDLVGLSFDWFKFSDLIQMLELYGRA